MEICCNLVPVKENVKTESAFAFWEEKEKIAAKASARIIALERAVALIINAFVKRISSEPIAAWNIVRIIALETECVKKASATALLVSMGMVVSLRSARMTAALMEFAMKMESVCVMRTSQVLIAQKKDVQMIGNTNIFY